jgi:hypothetical protein
MQSSRKSFLAKGEVASSILTGSTSFLLRARRHASRAEWLQAPQAPIANGALGLIVANIAVMMI